MRSFEWYIPFSYSSDTVGTANQQSNKADASNIYSRIDWLQPGDNESNETTLSIFNYLYLVHIHFQQR